MSTLEMRARAMISGLIGAVAALALVLTVAWGAPVLLFAVAFFAFWAVMAFPWGPEIETKPDPEPIPLCCDCRWWKADQNGFDGQCRVNQPWLFEGDHGGRWALTSATDWCGEFAPRRKPEA